MRSIHISRLSSWANKKAQADRIGDITPEKLLQMQEELSKMIAQIFTPLSLPVCGAWGLFSNRHLLFLRAIILVHSLSPNFSLVVSLNRSGEYPTVSEDLSPQLDRSSPPCHRKRTLSRSITFSNASCYPSPCADPVCGMRL